MCIKKKKKSLKSNMHFEFTSFPTLLLDQAVSLRSGTPLNLKTRHPHCKALFSALTGRHKTDMQLSLLYPAMWVMCKKVSEKKSSRLEVHVLHCRWVEISINNQLKTAESNSQSSIHSMTSSPTPKIKHMSVQELGFASSCLCLSPVK